MLILHIIILICIILIILALKEGRWWGQPPKVNESAQDILKRRLAQGEISIEDYTNRMNLLKK